MEVRITKAATGKGIDVGCIDLRAITAKVGIAKVISDDEDDVGGTRGR